MAFTAAQARQLDEIKDKNGVRHTPLSNAEKTVIDTAIEARITQGFAANESHYYTLTGGANNFAARDYLTQGGYTISVAGNGVDLIVQWQ